MSDTLQPNQIQQTDPFFNPVVAERWTKPETSNRIESPDPVIPEALSQDPYWQQLHEARQDTAESRAHHTLGAMLRQLSTDLVTPNILPGKNYRDYTGFSYSTGVYASSLLEMRDLDMLDTFLQNSGKEFTVSAGGNDISINRTYVGGPFETVIGSKQQMQTIESELAKARQTNTMLQVTQQLSHRHNKDANGDILDDTVSMQDDPLTFSTILSSLGLSVESYNNNLEGATSTEALQKLYSDKIHYALTRESGHVTLITDNEDPSKLTGYSWSHNADNSIQVFMVADEPFAKGQDISSVKWHLGWSINKQQTALEQANQAPNSTSEAFLDRPSGIEIVEKLSKSGLKFSSDIEQFAIAETNDAIADRFGGIYTEISRRLAKCIYDGNLNNRFRDIFDVTAEDEVPGEFMAMLKQFSQDSSQNPSVALLQSTINQIIKRGDSGNKNSSIPTSNAYVDISDGACFDVAGYYAGASMPGNNGLVYTEFGGVPFVHKNHGAKTYLNLDTVSFKGIDLPAGSLFIQASDGGLAFQRFTPYNFTSRTDMVDAFGTEVVKAEDNNNVNLENIAARIMAY